MCEKTFGPTLFKQLANPKTHSYCETYHLDAVSDLKLERLLDHGFIADRACVWDKRLNGHELAVVARTYCSDYDIDNPPEGLRCVRLDNEILGGDPGTAIAVVITGKGDAAESLLSACTSMPVDMLAYMISLDMRDEGYCIALQTGVVTNFPVARIVKVAED